MGIRPSHPVCLSDPTDPAGPEDPAGIASVRSRAFRAMGTTVRMQIAAETQDRANGLLDDSERLVRHYEHMFSANSGGSDLMRINKNAGRAAVEVQPELYSLISLGKTYSRIPGSNLNIAIGPVVKLWHIGFSDAAVPDGRAVRESLSLTDPSDIVLDDARHTVFLAREGMELDLGSLAKGYIGDIVADRLRECGVSSALLDFGGNIIAVGKNPEGRAWNIGIQDPSGSLGNYCRIVHIADGSAVTSGIYQRKLTAGGRTYHHIISPVTGYPVTSDMASITVLAGRSVTCELWTTVLFGASESVIRRIANELSGISVITVDRYGALKRYGYGQR